MRLDSQRVHCVPGCFGGIRHHSLRFLENTCSSRFAVNAINARESRCVKMIPGDVAIPIGGAPESASLGLRSIEAVTRSARHQHFTTIGAIVRPPGVIYTRIGPMFGFVVQLDDVGARVV